MGVLESLIHRARNLYTLPSVAVEVLKLTSQPDIDSHALKKCIECDPALSVKILRVVNSSLFGLRSEIVDLNQALALLGTKPLKLLVLGFNLPDSLFAHVTQEQLARYWTVALTRAVAAREIAQSLWQCEGDEAFIAGLLEDLGILVLLKELGEPYARMMDSVWSENADLSMIERMALGFDHRVLTTALLTHWGIPKLLVDAIASPRDLAKLKTLNEPHARIARILHLASLITDLVGQHRLNILPDLVECGQAYAHIDRQQLNELIEQLEPKVRDLANVFSFQLIHGLHFSDIALKAHQQMIAVAEEASGPLAQIERSEQQMSEAILASARQLTKESADFLARRHDGRPGRGKTQDRQYHAASQPMPLHDGINRKNLMTRVKLAVSMARAHREELSLLLFKKASMQNVLPEDMVLDLDTDDVFDDLADAIREDESISIIPTGSCYAAILHGRDRAAAIAYARDLLHHIAALALGGMSQEHIAPFCVGIASVAIVSKNFDAKKMVDAAQRCLYAAGQSGAGSVKSIELY